jgi:hypothetical protein
VDQDALAGSPAASQPLAFPVSHWTTAFMASVSFASPVVGHPSERPLPMLSASTDA